MFLIVVWIGNR